MAKRFTDTEKWKRPGFRQLSNEAKLAWIYILDQCDHRGIWPAAFDLMSFDLGFNVSKETFEIWFSDKVTAYDEDKYFINDFIKFQYKELKPTNNAHKGIIALLEEIEQLRKNEDLGRGSPAPLGGPHRGPQVTDKVKDKVKEKVSDSQKFENLKRFDFQRLFDLFPNHENKTKALTIMAENVHSLDIYQALELAIQNFVEFHRVEQTEHRFIPKFHNWFDDWHYWRVKRAGKPPIQRKSGGRPEVAPPNYSLVNQEWQKQAEESSKVKNQVAQLTDEERKAKAQELKDLFQKSLKAIPSPKFPIDGEGA